METKKVLISQPKPSSEKSPYYSLAEKYHFELNFHPFIRVERLSAKEFRSQKISILNYTAIVFTSRHAIDHFFNLCTDLRIAIPDTMKYFCITETVALYIQKYVQYRKRKIFFGHTGKINDLIPTIVKHHSERFFVPISEVHTDELKHLLEENNINHQEGVMYRTISNTMSEEEINSYNMLLFFSPSGVSSLFENAPNFKQEDRIIGCFGPATAKSAKEAGLKLDIEAPTPATPSMTSALEQFLKERSK
ncbi:MAG: uroporphyrinogen-III synthase [Bacteroidaceae bacterium]|nr:uroporphyrinogen-III synthase [Bacteroidaceae bacterium]